jgi:hypothetical protein
MIDDTFAVEISTIIENLVVIPSLRNFMGPHEGFAV